MTRTNYRIYDNAYPHLLTCTVVGWAGHCRPEGPTYDSPGQAQRRPGVRPLEISKP
jgi:hypothetical protein